MTHDSIEKFSTHLREVFARSIDTAWELQQESIPPIFLLWSIAQQHGSAGADILKHASLEAEHIRTQFPLTNPNPTHTETIRDAQGEKTISFLWPEFSTHTKRIIERAAVVALELQHVYIGTEHLLLALIEKADEAILAVLAEKQINTEELTKRIVMTMRSAQAIHDIQHIHTTPMNDPRSSTHTRTQSPGNTHENTESETPALDFFGIDLTSAEQQKRLTPVLGRDAEIDRLIHILCRKTKNNPVLIGDPGVGKTAIVEGLAQRIVRGTVPDALLGKRIVSLDLTLMISGTMYRGDYESRMKGIIEELKNHTDVIVFIDELHTIIGAGNATPGSLDTAHMLKPPLARGELRCIGATTTEEYRKHIEADSALERRFQPITVSEPSEEETITILMGIEEHYAQFHRVVYSDESIRAAVRYAARYLPDRRFPDKAIDILDEAGAMKRSTQPSSALHRDLQATTAQLRATRKKKMRAISNEQFQEAIDLKKAEDQYVAKLTDLQSQQAAHTTTGIAVTAQDIAQVVSSMCHVPAVYMHNESSMSIAPVRAQLEQSVLGQTDAIQKITNTIQRSLAGLQPEHKPLASVLCVGPSGVGKTLLARTLAQALFHSEDALLEVHMSEFSEGFAVNKILGAPAGYVGHKDAVPFIDHIRRHPYSVVLFDDIEKAHPDVINLLIQMMTTGKITDGTGRTVLCNHAVFILTAQIAEEAFIKQAELGFQLKKELSDKKETAQPVHIQEYFSAELLNALDAHITFAPLSPKVVDGIVQHHVHELNARLARLGLHITLSAKATHHIGATGFTPRTGARGIAHTFAQLIEEPLADTILQHTASTGDRIRVDYVDAKITWNIKHKAQRTQHSSKTVAQKKK